MQAARCLLLRRRPQAQRQAQELCPGAYRPWARGVFPDRAGNRVLCIGRQTRNRGRTRQAPRSHHCALPASPHPSAGSTGSGGVFTAWCLQHFHEEPQHTLPGAEEHLCNESLSPAAPTSDCCVSLFSKAKGRYQPYPSAQTFLRVLLQDVICLLLLPNLPLGLLENPDLQA